MALETRLAAGHWDRVKSRDVVLTYNLLTRAELSAAAPHVDWDAWIDGMQAPDVAFAEVVVRQPSFLDTLDEALTDVPLDDWKAWLTWNLVHASAPYLLGRLRARELRVLLPHPVGVARRCASAGSAV